MTINKTMQAWVAAAAVTIAIPASAQTYNLSYSGVDNGSPTTTSLFLNSTASGSVASFISGTRNGVAITGLTNFGSADNDLSYTSPFVDFSGISFAITGGEQFNFYSDNGQVYEFNSVDFPGGSAPDITPLTAASVTKIVAAAPEPATWLMMIVGFGLAGFALRSAKKRSDVKFNACIQGIASGAIA